MPERLDRASSFQATARYATNSHKGSKGVSKDSELSDGRRLPKETRRQPESSFRVLSSQARGSCPTNSHKGSSCRTTTRQPEGSFKAHGLQAPKFSFVKLLSNSRRFEAAQKLL